MLHLPYASVPLEQARNPAAGTGSRYPSWSGRWSARRPAVPGTSGRPSAAGREAPTPPARVGDGNDVRTGGCSGRPVPNSGPTGPPRPGPTTTGSGRPVHAPASPRSGSRSPPQPCSVAPDTRDTTAGPRTDGAQLPVDHRPGRVRPAARHGPGASPGGLHRQARHRSPPPQQAYRARTLRSSVRLREMPPGGSRSGTRPARSSSPAPRADTRRPPPARDAPRPGPVAHEAAEQQGTDGTFPGPFAARTYLLPVTTAGASESRPGRVPQLGGRIPVESGHGRREARLAPLPAHLPPPPAAAAASPRPPGTAPGRGGNADLRPAAQGVALGGAPAGRVLAGRRSGEDQGGRRCWDGGRPSLSADP